MIQSLKQAKSMWENLRTEEEWQKDTIMTESLGLH